ncbi:alkaline-phosphatase-like protein [Diplogelasinospora grovesii]|uniref:Alkaline phosphatase n=1 Tax=Diplogelasinospora grovesii TaxID=303347 RepID=A0AAN6N5Y6_9PEZI|nr:alkaline-phosphatase-like protein [Diplogelasinospora grovesii]
MLGSERTPLLADESRSGRRRRDSAASDRLAEEEDALLTSTTTPSTPSTSGSTIWRSRRVREILLFTWALLATAAVIVLAVVIQHRNSSSSPSDPTTPQPQPQPPSGTSIPKNGNGKRNLVFMVSDGMGPASLALTRSFRQLVDDLPIDDTLTLDKHFWGTSRTRSDSSLVTDSAAGATAFSCGRKSYNGAIAMTPDFQPCGTVLEAAKRAGYMTGLVVTTDITDATPACFASHVYYRAQEDEIALQEIGEGVLGRTVDLILGGGRCHFLPNTTRGSCRTDSVDVAGLAREKHGWTYVDDRSGFDSLRLGRNVSLPVLGLFAGTDIPFELDRKNMADVYPSLSEMAATALTALEEATRDSDQGFFLMIEGSRIDHAGHFNDPAAQVREVLEYDKTFKHVLEFLEESETDGVLVATSDHETGGLALAWQTPGELPKYLWHPSTLARANASAEHLYFLLREHLDSNLDLVKDVQGLKEWINSKLVVGHLGITDALDSELDTIASNPDAALQLFSHMISRRARVGWSTAGHSGVDVNIYSSGHPDTDKLRGNVENTDVGEFLREYLGVQDGVQEVTTELREKMKLPQPPTNLEDLQMEQLARRLITRTDM